MTMRLSTFARRFLPPDPSCNLTCFARRNKPASKDCPVWRPLVLEYPADARAREVDDEFMLGDDLLVAPVLTSSTSESSTFPTDSGWTVTPTSGTPDQSRGWYTRFECGAPLIRHGREP